MSLTTKQIEEVLADVRFSHFPSYEVRVGYDRLASQGHENGVAQPWLQIVDHDLPEEFNRGRKWRLSPHMTVSEVALTAWAAYKAWRDHEDLESFTYKGVQVFSPHIDIEARVALASDPTNYEYRS
jgi:hypothetical protein